MPFASINGLQLHYELHGSEGDPLVFVHGFTGDITDWRLQVPEFSPEHRVLVLDNRGNGRSDAPQDRAAYTVDNIAHDAERLVEHVGFERYHLVGHSMGGAVAQEIALRSPARLLSLTLQDTTCWAGDHGDGRGTPPYIPPELVAEGVKRVARMTPDALAGAWNGWISWRGTIDRAHAISTPTLILYGDRDASKIIEGSQRLQELIPHAETIVIPGAGHSPQLERPELFNEALRRHLASVSATRR
ncbi:MAG: alpha/beta fold hydrolase [Dehalococcoidia bacterium]|nr:alpha/beta fold hydrolase [Dehalococcoidia bacterium]MDZ4278298.1 alpha/beta fold hydrolase [Dehalococcoidia bacterium]